MGEPAMRALVGAIHDPRDMLAIATLVSIQTELAEIDQQRTEERARLEAEAVAAAKDAAEASKRSARWTMIAALASLAGVLLSVASARHWFGL